MKGVSMSNVWTASAGLSSGGRRGRLPAVLVAVFLLWLSMPLAAKDAGTIKLIVHVFRVPPSQQFETVRPDGRGGTADLQVYGNVTSSFPRATVFFPTELAADASEGAIAGAVLERVMFGSAGLQAKRIRIEELKSLELALGPDHRQAESRFEKDRPEGRTWDYDVRAEYLLSENRRFLVRLTFSAGRSDQAGSLRVGMSEEVVSAAFEIRESKLTLIGARSSAADGPFSPAVYWLAVSAVSNDRQ
jgi:hypothetical protein